MYSCGTSAWVAAGGRAGGRAALARESAGLRKQGGGGQHATELLSLLAAHVCRGFGADVLYIYVCGKLLIRQFLLTLNILNSLMLHATATQLLLIVSIAEGSQKSGKTALVPYTALVMRFYSSHSGWTFEDGLCRLQTGEGPPVPLLHHLVTS